MHMILTFETLAAKRQQHLAVGVRGCRKTIWPEISSDFSTLGSPGRSNDLLLRFVFLDFVAVPDFNLLLFFSDPR